MPWITPTQNTRLKLRPIDSAQLGTNEWRDRAAGDKLGIVSARKADGQHWEVLLSGPLTIGNKQHKSCFVFAPHWEGVGAVYQAAKAKDREVSIARMDAPKSEVRLPVPYLSQTDNSENPSGSCNVTSFAMCMAYFGVKQRTNAAQFEDELYRYMQAQGLSRHSPRDLRKMAIDYGLSVDFDSKATIERVKRHLSSGRPCVVHGYFTTFGHIVVFVGYDDRGFIVHDPYGEWHSWGYERNSPSNPTLGKYQHYSYGLIDRTCLTGGEFWAHFVDRAGWQPTTAAPMVQPGINKATIEKAVKAMAHPDLPTAEIEQLTNACVEQFPKFGLTMRDRIIHFFAQCGHESAGFYYLEELGNNAYFTQNYEGRRDLGNNQSGDGVRFKGRGLIQTTGRANYQALSKAVGIDYIAKPDLLATYPHALISALVWWDRNRMNELADRGVDDANVKAVTQRVNGGTNGLNDRLNRTDALKLVIR